MLTPSLQLAAAVPAALVLGAVTARITKPLLRRIPPPAAEAASDGGTTDPDNAEPGRTAGAETDDNGPDAPTATAPDPTDTAPDYGALATRRFSLACGTLAFAASLLALALAPLPWLPVWLVWATLFTVLVSVDGATTWLPLQLTRTIWAAFACALALSAVLALALGQATISDLGRVLVGAAASGAMYAMIWRVGQGLGFGDVRISPLIGALGASLSWTGWWMAVVAGPLLGALWGIARTATGRRGPFAYGPWMWLGPAAALVAQATGPIGG